MLALAALVSLFGLGLGVALLVGADPRLVREGVLQLHVGLALGGCVAAAVGHLAARRQAGRASLNLAVVFRTAPWWSSILVLACVAVAILLVRQLPEGSLNVRRLADVVDDPQRVAALAAGLNIFCAGGLQIALSGRRLRRARGL
ncbi:MAG: hypothetical protein KC486_10820 [Myxococcales bacterium]|nr:hypothetical protein [Myxococcales bacterium]